ncbi:MAG: DUF3788 domain-containing protein [Candidatus Hydrogenedentes bacterium]|jgi:hypothetical protein|nr:DUF3788 domain-containing protein [Candidatus Hydrogenedentota bacterium]
MSEQNIRMTATKSPPSTVQIKAWIGKNAYAYWERVVRLIEHNYPDVFIPEWLFGGNKHGWSLRYKKGKSFCTLIPEKNRFEILIVFGTEERAKFEGIRHQLSPQIAKCFDEAKTYNDGKWLLLTVDKDETINDIENLLALKRNPKQKV